MVQGVLWPQSKMLALYHLENVNDGSGNGDTFTNSGVGFGSALSSQGAVFDANTDRIYRYNFDTDGYWMLGDLTGMFWVKPTNLSAYGIIFYAIFAGAAIGQTDERIRITYSPTYKLSVSFGDASWYNFTELSAGKWYHIAFTQTAAGAAIVYINGAKWVELSKQSPTESIDFVGFGRYSTENALKMVIDEAVFFSEVKTPQWIRKYYAWATGKL